MQHGSSMDGLVHTEHAAISLSPDVCTLLCSNHVISLSISVQLTYMPSDELAGEEVAETIRRRVREEVHVTCSCGIGPNRLLAKVASDMRKPDGQYAIPPDNTAITRFIDALSIRKVPGIGKASVPASLP